MRIYTVGMIGAGQIAELHRCSVAESGKSRLTAVADLDEERAAALAMKNQANVYTDYREMVRQEKPDIVIINLPHFLHKEAAIWCAEQGCHVLLEKPMALNVQECTEMLDAFARHGVRLAIGHMQRFIGEYRTAKRLIDSGELGELLFIQDCRYGNYFSEKRPAWFLDRARSGGGVVINLGSHSMDRVMWLAGSRFAKVKAKMTYRSPGVEVEGSASMYLETESGVPAHIAVNGYQSELVNTTELQFTQGSLLIRPGHRVQLSRAGKEPEPVAVEQEGTTFSRQWEYVLDALRTGAEMSISGEYGMTVMAAVEAAYRSQDTGSEQTIEYPVRAVSQPRI